MQSRNDPNEIEKSPEKQKSPKKTKNRDRNAICTSKKELCIRRVDNMSDDSFRESCPGPLT
jgi:hypothetical protein